MTVQEIKQLLDHATFAVFVTAAVPTYESELEAKEGQIFLHIFPLFPGDMQITQEEARDLVKMVLGKAHEICDEEDGLQDFRSNSMLPLN